MPSNAETENLGLKLYTEEDYDNTFLDFVNDVCGQGDGTSSNPKSGFQKIDEALEGKVDKEENKRLSTNDYTNADKSIVEHAATKEELSNAIKTNVTDKLGANSGIATLDSSGKVMSGQLPSLDYLPYENGNISVNATVTGNWEFTGTVTQANVQTLSTSKYTIELAKGHTGYLGGKAGVYASNVDAEGKTVGMFFGADGVARVGKTTINNVGMVTDSTNLEALATRDEEANISDGRILKWDSTKKMLVDSGKTPESLSVTANSDAVSGASYAKSLTIGGTSYNLAQDITVDSSIDANSDNPVKNSVIANALGNKQNKLTFDTTPTSGSLNPVTSGGIYNAISSIEIAVDSELSSSSANPVQNKVIKQAIDAKQNSLTFDNIPTINSANPVKSGGVFSALEEKVSISDTTTFAMNTDRVSGATELGSIEIGDDTYNIPQVSAISAETDVSSATALSGIMINGTNYANVSDKYVDLREKSATTIYSTALGMGGAITLTSEESSAIRSGCGVWFSLQNSPYGNIDLKVRNVMKAAQGYMIAFAPAELTMTSGASHTKVISYMDATGDDAIFIFEVILELPGIREIRVSSDSVWNEVTNYVLNNSSSVPSSITYDPDLTDEIIGSPIIRISNPNGTAGLDFTSLGYGGIYYHLGISNEKVLITTISIGVDNLGYIDFAKEEQNPSGIYVSEITDLSSMNSVNWFNRNILSVTLVSTVYESSEGDEYEHTTKKSCSWSIAYDEEYGTYTFSVFSTSGTGNTKINSLASGEKLIIRYMSD